MMWIVSNIQRSGAMKVYVKLTLLPWKLKYIFTLLYIYYFIYIFTINVRILTF